MSGFSGISNIVPNQPFDTKEDYEKNYFKGC